MKVIAVILAFMGVVGIVGATTAPAPVASASPTTTTTTTTTALPDRFDRPPRMTVTPVSVAAVAKPHPAVKAVTVKPHKAVKRSVVRTHTATPVRAYTSRVVAGILPSAYRGPYYDPKWEPFRLCVINRESHGNYRARNSSSSASGAYQFLAAWTSTIQGWTGEHVAIWQMSRYAQDLAFWRALDHGRGAHNWAGGGYTC